MEIGFHIVFVQIFNVSAQEKALRCVRRIRHVLFLSKDGKDAAYEGRDGWQCVCFRSQSALFPL